MAKKKDETAPDVETRKEAEAISEQDLIDIACEAYDIPADCLLDGLVRDGVVTLITVGGSKVTWSSGQEITPLTRVQITGVNPANANRKPITGGKR